MTFLILYLSFCFHVYCSKCGKSSFLFPIYHPLSTYSTTHSFVSATKQKDSLVRNVCYSSSCWTENVCKHTLKKKILVRFIFNYYKKIIVIKKFNNSFCYFSSLSESRWICQKKPSFKNKIYFFLIFFLFMCRFWKFQISRTMMSCKMTFC